MKDAEWAKNTVWSLGVAVLVYIAYCVLSV